jgi:hypothetical protein
MRKWIVFSVVLFLHLIAQYAAWSYADSPKLNSVVVRAVSSVLAAPVVVIWGLITSDYFWIPMIANSVLWAAVAMYLYGRFGKLPSRTLER